MECCSAASAFSGSSCTWHDLAVVRPLKLSADRTTRLCQYAGRLFQLELDDVDRRRANVFHRARGAGLLPEELAGAQSPAAFRLARNAFTDLAAVDDDAHARRALGDGGSRLPRLQHQPPGAH